MKFKWKLRGSKSLYLTLVKIWLGPSSPFPSPTAGQFGKLSSKLAAFLALESGYQIAQNFRPHKLQKSGHHLAFPSFLFLPFNRPLDLQWVPNFLGTWLMLQIEDPVTQNPKSPLGLIFSSCFPLVPTTGPSQEMGIQNFFPTLCLLPSRNPTTLTLVFLFGLPKISSSIPVLVERKFWHNLAWVFLIFELWSHLFIGEEHFL